MNRIDAVFKDRMKKGKMVFIGYLTAGYPAPGKTPSLIKAAEEGGADIIEIGIPYSDPLADGPIIQSASQKALLNGVNVESIFESVVKIRGQTNIPLLFMAYFSTIFKYGIERFISRCAVTGIDGIIVPDMPLEERDEILGYLKGSDLCFIPLVAPTSDERIADILKDTGGFVYCVSTLGVTGMNGNFHRDITQYLDRVKELSDIPVCVGFGISKREDVEKLRQHVDGVIVGSALLKTIHETNGNEKALTMKVRELAGG